MEDVWATWLACFFFGNMAGRANYLAKILPSLEVCWVLSCWWPPADALVSMREPRGLTPARLLLCRPVLNPAVSCGGRQLGAQLCGRGGSAGLSRPPWLFSHFSAVSLRNEVCSLAVLTRLKDLSLQGSSVILCSAWIAQQRESRPCRTRHPGGERSPKASRTAWIIILFPIPFLF